MYINNDIASGKYNEVDIYFRKYITYPAKIDGNAATTYNSINLINSSKASS